MRSHCSSPYDGKEDAHNYGRKCRTCTTVGATLEPLWYECEFPRILRISLITKFARSRNFYWHSDFEYLRHIGQGLSKAYWSTDWTFDPLVNLLFMIIFITWHKVKTKTNWLSWKRSFWARLIVSVSCVLWCNGHRSLKKKKKKKETSKFLVDHKNKQVFGQAIWSFTWMQRFANYNHLSLTVALFCSSYFCRIQKVKEACKDVSAIF